MIKNARVFRLKKHPGVLHYKQYTLMGEILILFLCVWIINRIV